MAPTTLEEEESEEDEDEDEDIAVGRLCLFESADMTFSAHARSVRNLLNRFWGGRLQLEVTVLIVMLRTVTATVLTRSKYI